MVWHFKIEGKVFKRREIKIKTFEKLNKIWQFFINLLKNSIIEELTYCLSKNTSFINSNRNLRLEINWNLKKMQSFIKKNQFKSAMGEFLVAN